MASSPLTPDQLASFNQLKEMMPVDAVPGFSVASTGGADPASPWIKGMKTFSEELALNAYSYSNFTVRKGKLLKNNRKTRRIISPDGFPPWVTVSYATPPPFAFWTPNSPRQLTHFVFHSFGHMWHASYSKKYERYVGWMNKKGAQFGVQEHQLEGRTVYVAKGSDPETLAHFTRFSAGLRACLNSAAKATAHFFIDRAGNLIVIGDCNDILFTSNCLNDVSCGVELEEAFYVLKHPSEETAKWGAGGSPPGTAGNIKYADFSTRQLYTLAVLVKKLETVYEKLQERNINFTRKVTRPGDPPGYTMHDFIYPGVDKVTGAVKSGHIDVSPQYLTQDFWDVFFKLVDQQTQITSTNVFFPTGKYPQYNGVLETEPLSETKLTAMSEQVLQLALDVGVAKQRTETLVTSSKATVNANAASEAAKQSKQVAQKVASTIAATQQTQYPPTDHPGIIPEGPNGVQIGADDFF